MVWYEWLMKRLLIAFTPIWFYVWHVTHECLKARNAWTIEFSIPYLYFSIFCLALAYWVTFYVSIPEKNKGGK